MLKDISHLSPDEKKHFHLCVYCGNYIDYRDLGEVFLHAEGDCTTGKQKPNIDYTASQRVGESEEFLNDENKTKIHLN